MTFLPIISILFSLCLQVSKEINKDAQFFTIPGQHEQGEAELSLWIPVSMVAPSAAEIAGALQEVTHANLDHPL